MWVADANSEPANVVDALAMIASGLHDVADAIRHHGGWVTEEEAAKLEGVTVEQLRRDRGHSVPCDATVDRPA